MGETSFDPKVLDLDCAAETRRIRQWLVDAKAMTVKTKADRKPEMKSYSLPKDEVDALVAYLSSLKK